MRLFVIVALSCALCGLGCADDNNNNTGGSGGTAGTGGTAGGGGAAGEGGTAGGGGVAGSGGEGGVGGGSPAAAFCADYETICGFGLDRYADAEDCVTSYEGFAEERQGCVEMHLGLAEAEDDPDFHCPHATGQPPCS